MAFSKPAPDERQERAAHCRAIFARARKLGVDKDMVHDALLASGVSATPSLSALSLPQLRKFRDYYCGSPSWRDRPKSKITQDQLINELMDELGMDARSRAAFCAHVIRGYLANRGEIERKLFWPQDRWQKSAVIEGLKALKQKRRREHGESG